MSGRSLKTGQALEDGGPTDGQPVRSPEGRRRTSTELLEGWQPRGTRYGGEGLLIRAHLPEGTLTKAGPPGCSAGGSQNSSPRPR